MEDVIDVVAELAERGERGALASLVWSSGSIPMSDRAKMLVREDGSLSGTIGGGCLEAEVLAIGSEVLADGRSRLMRYTMTEKQAGESGLNCGGTVRIFTELIEPDEGGRLYGEVSRMRGERRGCLMATLLHEGSVTRRLLLSEEGEVIGTSGGEAWEEGIAEMALERLSTEQGKIVELAPTDEQATTWGMEPGTEVELFVEPFTPAPVLFVFGGGHVGGEIGRLAKNVGFRVVMIDDRPMFASPQRHPEADEWVVEETEHVFDRLTIDERSYIVAVTRGHQHDEQVVERAIRTPARYIGMLGSERKKLLMWKRIGERGGDRERLEQVYAPIGLNIGADTPQEIAVSVVAELIDVRRGSKKVWKTKRVG